MTAVALSSPRVVRGTVLRWRGMSVRYEPRTFAVNLALAAALVLLAVWSISAGDFPIPFGDVVVTLFGQGEGSNSFIIFGLRLPRLLTGIAVGIAFGISGAIFQSMARNPLASPDVIGFNSGAALGAVTLIIVFGATGLTVAFGALAGGLITAAIVYALSLRGGAISPLRLVLVGIGVGFAAYAGVEFLMTRSDIFEAAAAQAWLTGSLNARVWLHVVTIGIGLLVLVPAALILQRSLDRLESGDDMAAALGVKVEQTRLLASVVGVLLAALAVASAGPLAFVALTSGPIARRLIDASGSSLFTSAMVGAVLVTAADLLGRILFAPLQLPVGIFTAILGAPYLLWLLATQIRKGAM
jgi:iron complex transport system permease protein